MRSRFPLVARKMDYRTFEKFGKSHAGSKKKSRNRRWLFVGLGMTALWVVVIVALLTVLLGTTPIYLNFADDKFLEIEKCPACYGVCLCPAFLTGQITPDVWGQHVPAQLLGSRNVFVAQYRKKKVVLKKLAHDFELEHMDKHLLHHAPRLTSSHSHPFKLVSDAVRPYTHHHLLLKQEHDLQGNGTYVVQHIRVFDLPLHANSDGSESQQVGSDLLLCPSQRKFLYIEDRFVKDSWGVNRLTSLYNLMTILLVNSEPLIFQSFPASKGWPFPEYLGACGRFIVEEYVGPNLAEWLPRADWKGRMNAALQLLRIADQLTRGIDDFRLYVTDVSLYNVAVDPTSTLKLIDGENIVVVDLEKIRQERSANYDVPYASDNAGCEENRSDPHCSSYSQEDMCGRLYNDHNYFAICRELYSEYDHFGLVHGLPKEVTARFPYLVEAQQECYDSTVPGRRENAAKRIVSAYSQILSAGRSADKTSFPL